jgi:hypothetical protein
LILYESKSLAISNSGGFNLRFYESRAIPEVVAQVQAKQPARDINLLAAAEVVARTAEWHNVEATPHRSKLKLRSAFDYSPGLRFIEIEQPSQGFPQWPERWLRVQFSVNTAAGGISTALF